jgi:McbB family protein
LKPFIASTKTIPSRWASAHAVVPAPAVPPLLLIQIINLQTPRIEKLACSLSSILRERSKDNTMQDNHYILKDFDIYPDKESGALFYTPEHSAYIEGDNLIAMFHELKSMHFPSSEPTLERLFEKYNLQHTKIKKYLIYELKILSLLEKDRFDNLYIHADDMEINNSIHDYYSHKYGVTLYSDLRDAAAHSGALIFFFRSRYNAADFDALYARVSEKNVWVMSAYLANHYLIIDNLFHPQKGMACHFCNFNRHQNLMMSKNKLANTSWVNFSRRAQAHDLHALPAMKLTAAERGLAVFWLITLSKKFLSPHCKVLSPQDLTRYTWINLQSGEMNQEQAMHWMVCACRSEQQ